MATRGKPISGKGAGGELRIDGVPVGRYLAEGSLDTPTEAVPNPATGPGSIMMIVGTDAPLDARQLSRIARRAALGLARTGSPAGHGSGDFVIAFSNGNRIPLRPTGPVLTYRAVAEDGPAITELFQATVESVEEAILNSLFKAETVVGRDGHVRERIPIERVMAIMNARRT